MWKDINHGCSKAFNKNNYVNSNKNLPILLIAGTKDPVSDFGKGMDSLYEILNKIFTNINHVKINNDRHEVFSGLKKELAYNELISFIKSLISSLKITLFSY